MTWLYNEVPFTRELAQEKIDEGYIGFVYEITDSLNGKKYIGPKRGQQKGVEVVSDLARGSRVTPYYYCGWTALRFYFCYFFSFNSHEEI